ncbi:MAG: response regulator [Deltaproteobacteria bacterium]|nr:response regulator [Deltaproteobacteria bacterium]
MTEKTAPLRPTVMVVDDEPRVLEVLEKILGEEGYLVVTATSGERALALAAEASPDLIVLDIVMPGMDGVATLRELRRRGQRSPVIMLTAQGTVQTAREAMMLGAHDYITKPFNLEFLKSALREGLRDGPAAGRAGRRPRACAR